MQRAAVCPTMFMLQFLHENHVHLLPGGSKTSVGLLLQLEPHPVPNRWKGEGLVIITLAGNTIYLAFLPLM